MEVNVLRNRLLAMVCAIMSCALLTGCSTIIHLIGTPDTIVISGEILDDSEWIFTTAELWLKFSIEDSETFYLVPLNQSGNRTFKIKTPFKYLKNRKKTITVELLDDDGLSKEEIALLAKVAKTSTYLVCDGINIYTQSKNGCNAINTTTKKLIAECVADGAFVAVNNMKKFDSLGSREFLINNIANQKSQSMPLTIVEKGRFSTARCDLRFHLVP